MATSLFPPSSRPTTIGRRKERLESLADDLAAQRSQFDVTRHQRLDAAVGELRGGPHPVFPFHWEIEFPEVFDRENGGFDAFVGNPPFAGKNTMSTEHADGYLDWLKTIHEESHGNADLVAHFFRRAFDLLRPGGAFGLIATNTIGQGDTRRRPALDLQTRRHDLRSDQAQEVAGTGGRDRQRRPCRTRERLRGHSVSTADECPVITAYLFHAGGHDDPAQLDGKRGQELSGQHRPRAWASPSTTPTPRAWPIRSP